MRPFLFGVNQSVHGIDVRLFYFSLFTTYLANQNL